MPLSPDLATWLRGQGHDAVHAGGLGMHRAADVANMARAAAEQRIVVTADLDYPQLLAISRAIEPSVILFRDGNWSDVDVVLRMHEVLTAVSESDIFNSIVTVERNRVRRRRLPLG